MSARSLKKAGERKKQLAPCLRISNRHPQNPPAALKYFNSCPWDEWWQEFLTSRQKNGRPTYLTGWQFARAKAHSAFERSVIWRAIGPKVTQLDAKAPRHIGKAPVPHLGDWQVLRARAYFTDQPSVDAIKKTVAERLDGLEAGRGAATIILDLIAKWMHYDDRIDDVFEGSPVADGLRPAQQEKLAERFFKLKKESMHGILELVDKYLSCHGISHDGLNDLGQLVMAVSNAAAKSALTGAATGAALTAGGEDSPAFMALSKAIFEKVTTFKMPLPAAVIDDGEQGEESADK